MLIKDFYKIENFTSEDYKITATIKLNPNHEVYKGHFPKQPVVPGVIQLQIVKELLEKHLKKKLFMNKITQVKYLIPIIPTNSPKLVIIITTKRTDENILKSNISIGFDNSVFTKARVSFRII